MFAIYLKLIIFSILFSIKLFKNIDTDFPIVLSINKSNSNKDISGSYFGVTLTGFKQKDHVKILVGATKYQSQFLENVERSGSIFQCQFSENNIPNNISCNEIDFSRAEKFKPTNYMNLGSSLTRTRSLFVGCAHLYANKPFPDPYGICFVIGNQGILKYTLRTLEDTHPDYNKDVYRNQTSSHMFGFCSTGNQINEKVAFGSPLYQLRKGVVNGLDLQNVEYNGNRLIYYANFDYKGEKSRNPYFGYSITFASIKNVTWKNENKFLVVSAPNLYQFNGTVFIKKFKLFNNFRENGDLNSQVLLEGEPGANGEYFGATVLALDINNDGDDEVVVGAPLYSNQSYIEIGRVYIFSKQSKWERFTIIYGYKSFGHFGSALSSIDINLDNFTDLVVGAPYENNQGAVYLYLGSENGLNIEVYQRIGAEMFGNPILKGFGISIFSDLDFDGNGYNDLLIGSYLSDNAVILRTKIIAILSFQNITLRPNKKIDLKQLNCNDGKTTSIFLDICLLCEATQIYRNLSATITLEITDSMIKINENRAFLKDGKRVQEIIIKLMPNHVNCFEDAFVIHLNEPNDIRTPIELTLEGALNEISNKSLGFCKDCPIVSSTFSKLMVEFDHGCQNNKCVSKLDLEHLVPYGGQPLEGNLIEGVDNTLDIVISVANSGEASINTVVLIKMEPDLLKIETFGDYKKCIVIPHKSKSYYLCNFNKVLYANQTEKLHLYFSMSYISGNYLNISFEIQSDSSIEENSNLFDSRMFELVKQANLTINSEIDKNISYSDKIKIVKFQVLYNLVKTGPSSIDVAYVDFQIPTTNFFDLDEESKKTCNLTSPWKSGNSPVQNKTLNLNCEEGYETCSNYSCQLPKFNKDDSPDQFSLNLVLIPSKIEKMDFNRIQIKLNFELRIEDSLKFLNKVEPNRQSLNIYLTRNVQAVDKSIDPWIIFVSGGIGIIFLIIAVIILIRIGFFRRKKLEEIQNVKRNLSKRSRANQNNNEDDFKYE